MSGRYPMKCLSLIGYPTFSSSCTKTVDEFRKVKPFEVDKNEENFDKLEIELTKMNL